MKSETRRVSFMQPNQDVSVMTDIRPSSSQ
mgnify:CR=1 FL=1